MKQLQIVLSICAIIVCIVLWFPKTKSETSIYNYRDSVVLNMGTTDKGEHIVKIRERKGHLGYRIKHICIPKEEFKTINIGDTIQ